MQLFMSGRVTGYVASALGEEVFLYKEKINYKYPGAPFAYHCSAGVPNPKFVQAVLGTELIRMHLRTSSSPTTQHV